MNKQELVSASAAYSGLTKKTVSQALDALILTIEKAITSGDDVRLTNFGTFKLAIRGSRIGRNPQTGEEMTIPARKVPVFSPGKEFKEKVNNIDENDYE